MKKKLEPGMAYDTKKLNKIFAILSILFLMVTFWVFLDDYIRPWKAVQIEAMKIRKERLSKSLAEEEKSIDAAKLEELNKKLEQAEQSVASRNDEIEKVTEELRILSRDIKDETIVNGILNGNVGASTFKYQEALHHGYKGDKLKKYFDKMKDFKAKFAASNDRKKGLEQNQKSLKKKLEGLKSDVTNVAREIKDMTQTKKLLELALSKTKIDPIFILRNAPFFDYLDPTLKVQQIVLDNITDDRYFRQIYKVDRCITCHTFIDQEGFDDLPNPHKSHPKLDLMIGANSPHPMKQVGCTICHGGEGHRVLDFNAAAHTPENPEQQKVWEEKYGWHAPHKVPQVMLKKSMTEASCQKCHKGVDFVPEASKLNAGRMKMEEYGCYACHKLDGWEHKRKPGPSLEKIATKIDKKFFKSWVWDPKSFNKHAKMPKFFGNENNEKPEFMVKNIAEVNAMAEFIFSKSKDYQPFATYTGGNEERGKELIKSVGCMGCHGVEGYDEESEKVGAYAGPYLTGTGSKIKNGDWLVSWLIKPSHYQADTIMPSFRLSKREANDIAAYLMSLKNDKFEKLVFEEMSKEARDEVLLTYFSAFDTMEGAQKKLAAMSDQERTHELGKRSVGKYGCYSCHTIEGFDGRAPIGPELTAIGSKPLTQFGFNLQHQIEHSRDGWIVAHLQNPRMWDRGMDKPFKDLSRMPDFGMSEADAKSITTALLGGVSDYIPPAAVKQLNAHEKIAEEGMKVAYRYNCVGCHQVDGFRGDIQAMLDDPAEGPPYLVGQGHRVQADWFHHFLDNVYPIRPWLSMRMPSFNLTNEEKNRLVRGFQAKADVANTFEDNDKPVVWRPGEKAGAVKLIDELGCATCHTQGFNNDDPSAPNLYYAKRRLRPSWIKKWLKNPQAILDYTVMPNFWEDGESQSDVFGGDPEKQREAITKYLIEIGHDRYSPMDK